MVSERKKKEVEEIKELIEKYPIIGLIDLFKMPSRQLQLIRKNMRANASIRMCKKSILSLALKKVTNKGGIEKLNEFGAKEPALVFSTIDAFRLFKFFKNNKSPTYAKPNDVATDDILIPAGPTNLMAGPAIGEFQRAKIPAMVKEGKIHVREDTIAVKKNGVISVQLAELLKKLGIQPIEIGINVLAVWEDNIIYGKEVLNIDQELFTQQIKVAHSHALNLSVNISYPNEESIKILIKKGYQNAKNLGIKSEIFDTGIVEDLIGKADIEAKSLKIKLNI